VENAGFLPASRGSLAAVEGRRHGARPGVREVWVVWAMFGFVAAEIFGTYSRLPVHDLYHVSANGRVAALGRVVVFLNWPVALVAIPVVGIVAARARNRAISATAVLSAMLCSGVFWPGVVDQADLDAKWANMIPATGVLVAFVLTVIALLRGGIGTSMRLAGDRLRVLAVVVLVLIALPWIVADLGFLIGRLPLLGSIYYSDEWYAGFGHARFGHAVHPGDHHGMVGALLVVSVLLLSRTRSFLPSRLCAPIGVYLAIVLFYGLANIANDFWLEQIVKRGVTHWQFPSMTVPAPNVPWLILLVVAAATYAFVFRRTPRTGPIGSGRVLWTAALAPAIVALTVVGLLHGATRHVTPRGSASGIAFADAPEGTSHIYVTHGTQLLQVTSGDGTDIAPAWSPDHQRIAFQSSRDGNWEIYVANADGSGVRRLTDDDARDGEPTWSPDGKRIAFVRDGQLYEMRANGGHAHPIRNDGEWPDWSPDGTSLTYDSPFGGHHGIVVSAPGQSLGQYGAPENRRPKWSPDGKVIAYQCLSGHWHICVLDAKTGTVRVLTGHDSDAFAPTWSPDGKHIAFISDRDGNDQLYVMRANGTGIVRLTSGQGDKDTASWFG
jgi:hypothetical protein